MSSDLNNDMKKDPNGSSPKKPKTQKKAVTSGEIKKLINDSLALYLQNFCRETEDATHAVNSTLEEFYKTFMLIGYGFDGEPTIIINAKTQLDADALSTAFSKFFLTNIQNQNGNNQ